MRCPMCSQGQLRKKKEQEKMFGIDLGMFDKLVCNHCGESFTDEQTQERIEQAAKKKGIWGLGHKTKFTKSGNSIAVRIPKDIVRFLSIKDGQDAFVHPDGTNLVIESR